MTFPGLNTNDMYAKEILIEQTEKGLYWSNLVLVTRNHRKDTKEPIGNAWIMEVGGKYYADISELTIDPTGMYPSIGWISHSDNTNTPSGKIFELSICDEKNVDDLILPIGMGNGEVKAKSYI